MAIVANKVVSIEFGQPASKYVKADVIAAKYGVSTPTIRRMAKSGKIPAKRITNGAQRGLWMFDPEAVDAALDNQQQKHA